MLTAERPSNYCKHRTIHITRAPNSILSHCLITLAPQESRELLIDDVYAAYYEHGQDIGRLDTLLEIGARHGLDAKWLAGELAGEEARAQVLAESSEAQHLGINAVPFRTTLLAVHPESRRVPNL